MRPCLHLMYPNEWYEPQLQKHPERPNAQWITSAHWESFTAFVRKSFALVVIYIDSHLPPPLISLQSGAAINRWRKALSSSSYQRQDQLLKIIAGESEAEKVFHLSFCQFHWQLFAGGCSKLQLVNVVNHLLTAVSMKRTTHTCPTVGFERFESRPIKSQWCNLPQCY